MIKKLVSAMFVLMCLCAATPAPAETPTSTTVEVQVNPDDAGALLDGVVDAFKGGKWFLGIAFLTMLATWGLNRVPLLARRLPTQAIPWIAVALGLLTQLFTSLASGVVWHEALLSALVQGAGAAGLWSLLGKYLLPANPQSKS